MTPRMTSFDENATTMQLESTVRANPEHVSAEVEGETVILSLTTGEYYGLNSVAAHIWRLIQEPRRVVEVRNDLLTFYEGIDAETCTAELLHVLTDMVAMHLVEDVSPE